MVVQPLLVLQILTGASLFLGHGLGKLKDTSNTLKWFRKEGYGTFGGLVVILAEGIGSLLLILGILPRLSAALIAAVMLGAMVHHWKQKDSFQGGWEAAFLYFIAAVVVIGGGVSPRGLGL